jgi:putative hemolysin
VQLLVVVFYPLAYLYRLGLRLLQRTAPHVVLATGAERLQEAIQQQREEDSPEEEKAILRALVGLNAITVRSILRARVDVKALDIELTTEEVIEAVNRNGHSRLPVFENDLDSIRGILYVKDLLPLLGTPASLQWQTLVRPAYFIPEGKKIHRLLKEFQEKHLHIAIVTDEYGGTAGIVTLQDVLEEIFGDIRDEFDRDTHTHSLALQPDGTYLFEGRTSVLDFAKLLELDEDTLEALRGDSAHESLGGLVLDHAGEIPPAGYTALLAGIRFTVHAVSPNAIKQIRVEVPVGAGEEE